MIKHKLAHFIGLVGLSVLLDLGVVACTPTKPAPAPTVIVTGCTGFKLISASPKDTPETKRQIIDHNAVYQQVCHGS